MEETKCEVIRDLLPLYEDNAVSEETQEMVRRHLKDCPACREELRKMRTPISLPPDEDEEAVKRFLAHRAEVRKKQNVKIACVVSALTLILAFILCYTLIPRSWNSVAGLARTMEPDQVMAVQITDSFVNGEVSLESWKIDEEQEENTELIDSVMETLRAGSYRAELRNVINSTPLAPFFQIDEIRGLRGSFHLYLVKDNSIAVSIQLYDLRDHVSVHICSKNGSDLFYYYRMDGQLYDTLSALMKEYGVKSN